MLEFVKELHYNIIMLVSHESPISILDHSRHYNDYEYALVHLFETHPKYYNFFKTSLSLGREVMLDNSIFELGTAFDSVKFADYINELKPTYYIVPDVLEESKATMESFWSFITEYEDLPGLKVGVVQGKTYDEIIACYEFMVGYADYIAISFDYSFYQVIGIATSDNPERAKLERMCDGRQKLINMLIADGIWDHTKPHHLLGCSLSKEFSHYANIKSIRSVDTSNPVVAGIVGQRYLKEIGLYNKPKVLLADLIDAELTADQMNDVIYNVEEFKNICNA
jgi:hypothetical protein